MKKNFKNNYNETSNNIVISEINEIDKIKNVVDNKDQNEGIDEIINDINKKGENKNEKIKHNYN